MMSVRLFLSCQLANPDMSMVVHACNPKKFSLWDFFFGIKTKKYKLFSNVIAN